MLEFCGVIFTPYCTSSKEDASKHINDALPLSILLEMYCHAPYKPRSPVPPSFLFRILVILGRLPPGNAPWDLIAWSHVMGIRCSVCCRPPPLSAAPTPIDPPQLLHNDSGPAHGFAYDRKRVVGWVCTKITHLLKSARV